MNDRFGTEAQSKFAASLARELGLAGLRGAIADATGTAPPEGQPLNLSTTEASAVITVLKGKFEKKYPGRRLKSGKGRGSAQDAPTPVGESPAAQVPGAQQIRRWAQGTESYVESSLDPDTRWVLDRLARYDAVLQATKAADVLKSSEASSAVKGINDSDPILVEHLGSFFGSEEEAAKAMGVSVSTFRAWGTYVPPQRAWQAEVLTDGYVRAPRRAKGD